MRAIAAYLLAVLGGNPKPDERCVVNILHSVGIEVNREEVSLLIEKLDGKDLDSIISEGSLRLETWSTEPARLAKLEKSMEKEKLNRNKKV